jgi:hypothetical protein
LPGDTQQRPAARGAERILAKVLAKKTSAIEEIKNKQDPQRREGQ